MRAGGTHRGRGVKRILPITLILLGTMALSGCFFIPTFNAVISGRNVAKDVGGANSKRPLRVGSANGRQVIALLGYPPFASDDGKRIAYTWVVRNGIGFIPSASNPRSSAASARWS